MHQVVKMSTDEKKEMYRKVRKEKLIEMLISANDNLDLITRPIEVYLNSEKIRPSLPNRVIPDVPKEDRSQISEGSKEPNYEMVGAAIFGIGTIFGMFLVYILMLITTK